MALAPIPTLGEIRQAVMVRCGLATTGTLPQDSQQLLDELIRSAQRQLYHRSFWLRQRIRSDITLVEDQALYDWPEETPPDSIVEVTVIRADDDQEFPLVPGIRYDERNDAARASGCPTQFEWIDGQLQIYPAPDAEWSDLRVTSYGALPAFVADTERAVVDGESLIMLAELMVKEHYEMPGTKRLEYAFEQYLSNFLSRNSEKTGVSLSPGRQPAALRPHRKNRQGGPYNVDDWHPW